VDELEATAPLYLLESTEPCWKCGQPQSVIAIGSFNVECEGARIGDGKNLILLSNVESMPDAVFAYVAARNNRFKKHHSYTADSTYYANTCECGANFGDFYLFMEPDGAFFPTTASAASKVIVEAMPFSGRFSFVGSFGDAPSGIAVAV
jgi:hypothetical protein